MLCFFVISQMLVCLFVTFRHLSHDVRNCADRNVFCRRLQRVLVPAQVGAGPRRLRPLGLLPTRHRIPDTPTHIPSDDLWQIARIGMPRSSQIVRVRTPGQRFCQLLCHPRPTPPPCAHRSHTPPTDQTTAGVLFSPTGPQRSNEGRCVPGVWISRRKTG